MENNNEQAPKIETRPLNQRVTEFLTAFAEEKAKEQTPKGKETLVMAQTAACYRLAASVAQGDLNLPTILAGVKKYGMEYHLALNRKRKGVEEAEMKNPAKKIYEDLGKADPQALDVLLMQAEFLNKKGSLSDPSKITDPRERDRVEKDQAFIAKLLGKDQAFIAKLLGKKFQRPANELAELFVYSRQRGNLKRLNDKTLAIGDTLQDLQKIVPRKP